MKKDTIVVEEVWSSCDPKDSQAFCTNGKYYKLVAKFANGKILFLEKDFFVEKQIISSEEFKNIYDKKRS